MSLRVITWNVEWATPSSPRASEILRRIGRHAPEVVCLTETHVRLMPQDGYTICAQPDYGYTVNENRRKVILWSREPWEQVDDVGINSMPPGRFVSGVTKTSLGTCHSHWSLYSLVRVTDRGQTQAGAEDAVGRPWAVSGRADQGYRRCSCESADSDGGL